MKQSRERACNWVKEGRSSEDLDQWESPPKLDMIGMERGIWKLMTGGKDGEMKATEETIGGM